MPASKFTREASWDSLRHSEASTEDDYNLQEGIEETDEEEEEPLMTIGDVHRALHPLQATADRVGKQAEQFAESLDRLSPRSQGIDHAETNDILPLVYEYEKIAADTVKRLKRHHESERQQLLQRSFQRQLQKDDGKSTPSDYYQEEEPVDPSTTTVEDLDHWENERQTWQLFGLLLQAHSVTVTPPTGLSETFVRPTHTSKPHPYSTEHDVWDYYLEHNPDMWEKHVVVEWLKSNADNTGQDIDTIVEQLQSGTERGSELWQQGWLYSKESIKAQKRLRSWPKPLDPASPGIGKSLVNSAGTEGLVTQLDPDAFSRQGRQLAEKDVFFEKATWIACWEMLRRGYTWDSIREWGEDHAELWQSLSMRGDPRPAHDSGQSSKASWRSRALWRKMCMKLARYGGINEYERAAYGVLSGELASVRKVARTWDDLLFAYYNSQLLQNFDLYVQKTFPERIPSFRSFHDDDDNAIGAIGMDGGQALDVLLHSETTKEEARSPLKLLQGSIIANRTVRYLVTQACALSQVLSSGDGEARKLARRLQQNGSEPTAAIQLSSYDVLRILTHLAFALQDLGQLGASAESIEQIVVAYVDFLGKAGKQQLLPLYASRLSSSGAIECMARQLPFVTDNGERKTMLNLMHQYGMDVPGILLMQIVLVTQDQPMRANVQAGYQPLQILEKLPSGRPGVSPIKQNFLSDEIQDDEWDLINGMEWYLLLDQHWNETMYAGSLVYKYMLLTGSLAAARELSRRVPFSTISLNKTEDLLGKSVDLSIFSDDESQPPSPDRRRQQGSNARPVAPDPAQRSSLLHEAHTFRALESLMVALDAMETFASVAARQSELGADARHAKAWKQEMQHASDSVAAAMEPLLEPGWLSQPAAPREGAELAAIRAAYLPELVLAYVFVISTCGQVLSRDILLRGMDLATIVAGAGDSSVPTTMDGPPSPSHRRKSSASVPPGDAVDREELAHCFRRAGRMAELVNALAALGRLIVQADEKGRKGGRRSGRRSGSEGLGIWTVGGAKGRVLAVEE